MSRRPTAQSMPPVPSRPARSAKSESCVAPCSNAPERKRLMSSRTATENTLRPTALRMKAVSSFQWPRKSEAT